MLSKCLSLLKKKKYISLLLLIAFYCVPVFAISIENSCLNENKKFISRYFSAQNQAQPQELEDFFDCIDSTIQLFLNHSHTKKIHYYTQTELRRLMQYMGVRKPRAEEISQAVLKLKTGFIGGRKDRLSLAEIIISRQILSILRQRMRSMYSTIPILIKILNKKNIKWQQLINVTETMKTNLITLGIQLSKKPFSSHLSLLSQLPQNIKILGFTNANLKYWKSSLSLLSQWKNIFLNSPEHVIHSTEWPFLLDSFGQLATLWFYYKRFLESRSWLDFRVIQHTQHFLSQSLDVIRDAQKKSGRKNIFLQDIDELAHRVWFLPYISKPAFRLGLRSIYCFLLNSITNNNACEHKMYFTQPNLKISFSDVTFTITETKEIYESKSGNKSDQIKKSHLEIIRQYMNSWIITENQIRKTSQIPPLFGSPHKWLKRKINITPDRQLLFYTNRENDIPFLSHLNWQSHLMKLVTSSYTKRGTQVDQKTWNTMIREWTVLSISLFKDIRWESFQKLGFQVFKHGDFLTSYSNGDKTLQEEEILELFSLLISSLGTVISALEIMPTCRSTKMYYLHTACVINHLQHLPPKIFTGFPRLLEDLSSDENKKTSYIGKLHSFYNTKETLHLKDLFELFLFIHHQENTMEYLDKDFSQHLNTRELEPLLNTFEDIIIDDIPLIYTKREVFAFITYLFHYGKVPIFNKEISSPLHFNNWLLQPKKWKRLKADRKDVLHTLFLMNKKFN